MWKKTPHLNADWSHNKYEYVSFCGINKNELAQIFPLPATVFLMAYYWP